MAQKALRFNDSVLTKKAKPVPYRWQDIPGQMSTPQGRFQLAFSLFIHSRPLLIRAAAWYRRKVVRRTRVAAIVGSFGKSTTTRAVATTLCGDVDRLFEFNSPLAVALAVLRIRPGMRYAAMEVGITGPGQMSPVAEMIRPDIAVVTCIGSEHNRSFGTLEAIREEKSGMVAALPSGGLAVLNGDDAHVLWMKRRTAARVITYGFGGHNDILARNLCLQGLHGMSFDLSAGGRTYRMNTRLLGRHMVYPLLAAIAAAVAEEIALAPVLSALESLRPPAGRMQPVSLPNGVMLIRDDYKSSLETVESALDFLADIKADQKIVVLGEISEPPGSQGPIYRKIGLQLAQTASRVVVVAEKKAFERYRSGLNRGGFPKEWLVNAKRSALEAAEFVKNIARPGDVVLIKGKDIQRMERVAFALAGKRVRCDLIYCHRKASRCAHCDRLEPPARRCRWQPG
jgi:UDP-N-acetylmuramyl pentapeptide synthase